MARAKRHYIPGQIWHLTHRCHKREFLLKFAKDRGRYLQWLREATKRYGLVILDYMVTSNHIHLLVVDDAGRDVIPKSVQLVAGRTGQEYNQRKRRKGAFWEDRYHATAVEGGVHLLRCIVYLDLNMVRAGAVRRPCEWSWSGFGEIQRPRRKCALIDYGGLHVLTGFDNYEQFQNTHKAWVEEALADGRTRGEGQWTRSIAVGSEQFVGRRENNSVQGRKGGRSLKAGKDINYGSRWLLIATIWALETMILGLKTPFSGT